MHIPPGMLIDAVLIAANLVALLGLLGAVFTARWSALIAQPGRLHLIAGGSLACLLLWLLNMHIANGVVLHFLGVTALTLVIGWSFTLLGLGLVLIPFTLLQQLSWDGLGLAFCLTGLVPASITRALLVLLYRPSLRHPFVYFLGAGFAGGGLVVLALSLITAGIFWLSGLDGYLDSMGEFWPLVFLIMFSEGFINGMCISALAVFYPDWVKTFDDRFYLDNP